VVLYMQGPGSVTFAIGRVRWAAQDEGTKVGIESHGKES
jgi:hypothetical protein